MDEFFSDLESEIEKIRNYLKNIRPLEMTKKTGTGTEQLIFVEYAMDHSDRTMTVITTDYGR